MTDNTKQAVPATQALAQSGIETASSPQITIEFEASAEATLDKLAAATRREATTLSDRALVLIVNRLTAPGRGNMG